MTMDSPVGKTAETENKDHDVVFSNTLAHVVSQNAMVTSDQLVNKVEEIFNHEPNLVGIIVVSADEEQLVGMISRKYFMELYSKPFRKELYLNKSLNTLLATDFEAPLCLDESSHIDYAVRTALSRSTEQMYEPIVVRTTQGGLKLIDTYVLLLELAKLHERQSMELHESLSQVKLLNTQLEDSQERILESLHYASVIQESILPRTELFDQLFSEWFTLYRPRDIVGGDLYWLRKINELTLIAVIDCTGHGVPGAFMTMTVNSVLNHIADTICYDDPARILSEMNLVLKNTLHLRQDSKSTVDAGLDIILCCIDPAQKKLTFAGAGLSLYMYSNGDVDEIKGGRAGIGYSNSDPDYRHSNIVKDVAEDTILYATTDGFLDESGGAKGFGFGRERFKNTIKQCAKHSLKHQHDYFCQTLTEWRGSREQRDDIALVVFKPCNNR